MGHHLADHFLALNYQPAHGTPRMLLSSRADVQWAARSTSAQWKRQSGSNRDISVNLTAPGSNGTYTGNYKLRDSGGVYLNNFCAIKVGGRRWRWWSSFAVTSVTYDTGTLMKVVIPIVNRDRTHHCQW
jgi:hypothetical protein